MGQCWVSRAETKLTNPDTRYNVLTQRDTSLHVYRRVLGHMESDTGALRCTLGQCTDSLFSLLGYMLCMASVH